MKILFDDQSNVLTLILRNGCVMQQAKNPQTGEPVTQANFEAVAQASVPPDEWQAYRKLKGVDYLGTLCSATAADQAGITSVLYAHQLQGAAFEPTVFYFENGSKLTLNKDNIQSFANVWVAFRQSFFKAVS